MLAHTLYHVTKIATVDTVKMVNEELVAAVGYVENGDLTKQILVLLLLLSLEILLPSELNHFPVRIRMLCGDKSRACGGSVLGYESTRFEADPTGVAQGFRAHRARSPLWGLLRRAVKAFPARGVCGLFFDRRCRFVAWGWGNEEEAGRPVARCGA